MRDERVGPRKYAESRDEREEKEHAATYGREGEPHAASLVTRTCLFFATTTIVASLRV